MLNCVLINTPGSSSIQRNIWIQLCRALPNSFRHRFRCLLLLRYLTVEGRWRYEGNTFKYCRKTHNSHSCCPVYMPTGLGVYQATFGLGMTQSVTKMLKNLLLPMASLCSVSVNEHIEKTITYCCIAWEECRKRTLPPSDVTTQTQLSATPRESMENPVQQELISFLSLPAAQSNSQEPLATPTNSTESPIDSPKRQVQPAAGPLICPQFRVSPSLRRSIL